MIEYQKSAEYQQRDDNRDGENSLDNIPDRIVTSEYIDEPLDGEVKGDHDAEHDENWKQPAHEYERETPGDHKDTKKQIAFADDF